MINSVVLVSYAYDPYGNIRTAPGQNAPLAWWNPYTYTGALKDNANGLYRMGVRWYDPNTGRFTTPDPTAQETNPYLYAGGNPCNNTDPTGSASGAALGCNIGVGLLSINLDAAVAGAVGAGLFTAGVGFAVGAVVTLGGAVASTYICDV